MDIKKIEEEIKNIISKSPFKTDWAHAKSTRKWVMKLKPDADISLQIAALAHDIERGLKSSLDKSSKKFDNYKDYKKIHSEKSAKIIVDLLNKHNYEKDVISKVKELVLKHEFGGDFESDILKDADSISFFEENLELYFIEFGEDKTRKKINFMFGRISPKGQELVKELNFKNERLNLIFKEEILKI